jgi:hypothetical protein
MGLWMIEDEVAARGVVQKKTFCSRNRMTWRGLREGSLGISADNSFTISLPSMRSGEKDDANHRQGNRLASECIPDPKRLEEYLGRWGPDRRVWAN